MPKLIDTKKKTLTVNLSLEEYTNLHYFQTLLENSAVTKSDLRGNITYVNRKFTEITGFSEDELLGQNHRILRHPDNDNDIFKDLWDTVRGGKIWRERLLNRNKDGSDFWAETTIIPLISTKKGELIEYIAIRQDITDFLKLKREIFAQQNRAREEKEISKAKDSFLILFTHELKTPLNAIISFTKYLIKHAGNLDNLPNNKALSLLERIEDAAHDMLSNVMQLLELSRLRANKLQYNISTFNSFQALQEVVEEQRNMANERGVEITCENLCELSKSANLYLLESDELRFKQIFRNILSNAIKYTKNRVHLSLFSDSTTWRLRIEDNGPGISKKEGVFDLFEKEKKTNSGVDEGTGVGLTFVKYLCKDLGFTYHLGTSEKLGGLDFVLTKT